MTATTTDITVSDGLAPQDRPRQGTPPAKRVSVLLRVIKLQLISLVICPGLWPYVEMWPLDEWHIPPHRSLPKLDKQAQDDRDNNSDNNDDCAAPATESSSLEVLGACTRSGIVAVVVVVVTSCIAPPPVSAVAKTARNEGASEDTQQQLTGGAKKLCSRCRRCKCARSR